MINFSRHEITEVIAGEFDLLWSDIQPTDRLDSLTDGFDVIDRMRLCRKLGTAFRFYIPWEDDEDLETVQDIYDYMESKYAEAKATV